jgi:hypothetical protein
MDSLLITDGTTFINGFGLGLALLMGMLLLCVPRRHALLPVIVLICFETMGQRVMIAGLNFTMIRLLLLFGVVRVVLRREVKLGGTTPIDRAMLWWVLSSIVTYTLLWRTRDALVNRLGMAYDALGLLFLFRVLVRDLDDMGMAIRHFARCSVILAACMLYEKFTAHNPFAALGGVEPITVVRDGTLRCQGPFAHPILAGTFGGSLVPLFLGLRAQRRGDGLLVMVGLAAALTIVVCAGSSGPLVALMIALLGWSLFFMRENMAVVRRALLFTVIALHLVMSAPVWFLLGRMTVFDGSTGYHRSILVDHAIHHFPDWALIGIYSTANWGFHMFDVTNNYVLQAVQGGLVTLILFLLVIVRGFSAAGAAVKRWGDGQRAEQKLAWALGCALLFHCVNYVSVVYFDQNIVCWYLLLGMLATISMIAREALAPATASEVLEPSSHGRSRESGRGRRPSAEKPFVARGLEIPSRSASRHSRRGAAQSSSSDMERAS